MKNLIENEPSKLQLFYFYKTKKQLHLIYIFIINRTNLGV